MNKNAKQFTTELANKYPNIDKNELINYAKYIIKIADFYKTFNVVKISEYIIKQQKELKDKRSEENNPTNKIDFNLLQAMKVVHNSYLVNVYTNLELLMMLPIPMWINYNDKLRSADDIYDYVSKMGNMKIKKLAKKIIKANFSKDEIKYANKYFKDHYLNGYYIDMPSDDRIEIFDNYK